MSLPGDEAPVLDARASLALVRAVAHAWAPDAQGDANHALRAVAEVLWRGLAAQSVSLHRVVPDAALGWQCSPVSADDAAIALAPGHHSLVRQSCDERCAVVRPGVAGAVDAALPVLHAGRIESVLLCRGVALNMPAALLFDLLQTVQLQLALWPQRVAASLERKAASAPNGNGLMRLASGEERGTDVDATLLRDIFENLPVSLFLLDLAELTIVTINAFAAHEFELPGEQVQGKTLREVFGQSVHELVQPVAARALLMREPVAHEYEVTMKGRLRTVSASHLVLRQPGGAAGLMVVVARDVTDQRQAKRDLLESEARFREFVETVEDIFFVTNPHRTEFHFLSAGKLDGWNPTRDGLVSGSKAFLQSMYPQDRSQLGLRLEAELRLEPTDISYRAQHPERGERWLRVRTRSRKLPQGDIRVYGLVSDVTDDRVRQQELQAARDVAEQASQAKSQFMASMSHEIRTPMNGILGMTELLLGTPLNDKQRRFVQAVYRSGESLLEIINDILDFSKIEAGRLEIAEVDFALRNVVEDTLELLAPRAHEKGLELSFKEADGLPAMVRGDPLRLRQVLTNLVANAIKFTEHGEVAVSLVPADEPGACEFVVSDSGIGIEADVLPRLFSAFTQGSVGMARRFGGTGLGLSISKQLVELMGGHIHAQSQPGVGSRFSFTLPFGASLSDSVSAPLDAASMPSLRVLVVDDNETNRLVLENMLHAWGAHVVVAHDGREAIELLTAVPAQGAGFDLALVDMQMPQLDGMGFARVRRAAGLQPDMKMILLSSACAPDDVRAAHEAGFERFIPKPVRRSELRQAIAGISANRGLAEQLTHKLNGHILVVEDNMVNQEVIGQMLRALGCRVQVCPGGLAGLRALCDKRFDLVLMDIQMPGMDGIEALKWFRQGKTSRFNFLTPTGTPVIAVTANALEGDKQRFLDLGFDGYLSKPFRQSQLHAMLIPHLSTQAAPEADACGTRPQGPVPAPTPALTSQILDANALDQLRKLDPTGESHLMERLVSAFETSVARLMPQLQTSMQSLEMGGIRHVAHTLKSSSASIGAVKLSKLCSEIEAMARQEQSEGLSERVALLQAEVEIVRVALKQLLIG